MIPLTILTGFLGAGKTTLLNHVLHGDHGLRVAVMVNDFGTINVDAELIADVAGDRIDLANGCICCTIRDDLRLAALDLVSDSPAPEYIIIEASGVSDPAEVARTFMLPELASHVRLDAIITVVDAEQIRSLPRESVVLAMDQIGVADIVLLNKVDLVEEQTLIGVETWIRGLVPRARIVPAVRGRVPLELLLGVELGTPEHLADREIRPVHVHASSVSPHDHDHAVAYETTTFASSELLSWRALKEAFRDLPPEIYRAKGIAYVDAAPERRALIQVVGPRVELTLEAPWEDAAPRTQLVFIAAAGALDDAALQSRLGQCVASGDEPSPLARIVRWLRRSGNG